MGISVRAELCAITAGLEIAWSRGITKLIIEWESELVIDCIKKQLQKTIFKNAKTLSKNANVSANEIAGVGRWCCSASFYKTSGNTEKSKQQ